MFGIETKICLEIAVKYESYGGKVIKTLECQEEDGRRGSGKLRMTSHPSAANA